MPAQNGSSSPEAEVFHINFCTWICWGLNLELLHAKHSSSTKPQLPSQWGAYPHEAPPSKFPEVSQPGAGNPTPPALLVSMWYLAPYLCSVQVNGCWWVDRCSCPGHRWGDDINALFCGLLPACHLRLWYFCSHHLKRAPIPLSLISSIQCQKLVADQ